MADERSSLLREQLATLCRRAWEQHQAALRDEVDAGRRHGFTPGLSLLGAPPDGDAVALVAWLAEWIDDVADARARALARLSARPAAGPDEQTRRRIRSLERQVDNRRDTLAKLVDKAFDQGQTIELLRSALAALATGDIPVAPVLRPAGPDYAAADDIVVLPDEDETGSDAPQDRA